MASCGMPFSASSREKRPVRAAGYSAIVARPALCTAVDTFTPCPPGTSTPMARRYTPPRSSGPEMVVVRSMDGFAVRVRIIGRR